MGGISSSDYYAMLARTRGKRLVPFAGADAEPHELDLHDKIIEDCKRRGWKYVHSNPSRPTTCGEGVCDFIIYADRGRVFNIECKSRIGKLSDEQNIFIVWLQKLGHNVHTIRSMSEYMEIVG